METNNQKTMIGVDLDSRGRKRQHRSPMQLLAWRYHGARGQIAWMRTALEGMKTIQGVDKRTVVKIKDLLTDIAALGKMLQDDYEVAKISVKIGDKGDYE